MTKTEKAIRDFCGHCADWWPSATQVQAMLALAQPCTTCEALARTVMLDQTSHDTKRPWVGLTPEEVLDLFDVNNVYGSKWIEFARTVESALRSKNT